VLRFFESGPDRSSAGTVGKEYLMSTLPAERSRRRVTTTALAEMKAAGEPIVMITAYDAPGARLVEAAGVDVILVGDSLGMTVLGHGSTLPVTMDDMVRHTSAVVRGSREALVVADMPFMSYQASYEDALRNAGRFLAEAGAHAVKLEGGERVAELVGLLTDAGIPVMGHVGLTPQSVNVFGGYRLQGRTAEAALRLVEDCLALEAAGAFAVVLELVPAELAALVSEELAIPTIGIGAGAGCDGQVQVFHDLLGLGDFTPKHAKRYAEVGTAITKAVAAYTADVRGGAFPGEAQTSHLDAEVVATLERSLPRTDEED
jgi:3-methyl-2-oxobutanoate hydroxymethyltransferase